MNTYLWQALAANRQADMLADAERRHLLSLARAYRRARQARKDRLAREAREARQAREAREAEQAGARETTAGSAQGGSLGPCAPRVAAPAKR